jgi:hypothetical protein
VVVKAAFACLAHALIIAMAWVNSEPEYQSYRKGYILDQSLDVPLKAFGVDLSNGCGLDKLKHFQNYLSD